MDNLRYLNDYAINRANPGGGLTIGYSVPGENPAMMRENAASNPYDDVDAHKREAAQLEFMLRPGNVRDYNAPDVKATMARLDYINKKIQQIETKKQTEEDREYLRKQREAQDVMEKIKQKEAEIKLQSAQREQAFKGVPFGQKFVPGGTMVVDGKVIPVPRAGTVSPDMYAAQNEYIAGRAPVPTPEQFNLKIPDKIANKEEAASLLGSMSKFQAETPKQEEQKSELKNYLGGIVTKKTTEELRQKVGVILTDFAKKENPTTQDYMKTGMDLYSIGATDLAKEFMGVAKKSAPAEVKLRLKPEVASKLSAQELNYIYRQEYETKMEDDGYGTLKPVKYPIPLTADEIDKRTKIVLQGNPVAKAAYDKAYGKTSDSSVPGSTNTFGWLGGSSQPTNKTEPTYTHPKTGKVYTRSEIEALREQAVKDKNTNAIKQADDILKGMQ